jgi:hypothetical protein
MAVSNPSFSAATGSDIATAPSTDSGGFIKYFRLNGIIALVGGDKRNMQYEVSFY